MTQTHSKTLSPFAESALALDADFTELEELSGQIERLSLESEHGLDRARLLLSKFSECSLRIGDGVQRLAGSLDEARQRAEKAAQVVAERAVAIQERQKEADQLLARFQALGEMVRKVTVAVSQLHKPAQGELSAEEKALLIRQMPDLDSNLGVLVNEARSLKEDARSARLRTLERNADSLDQSLQSVRRKLNAFVDQITPRAAAPSTDASFH